MIKKLFGKGVPVVLKNLIYLYVVQGANYVFPLLTLPYLSRVLKPEGFGVLVLGQALSAYMYLVIEYGFNLSATREVSRNREDAAKLAEIFSGVIGAKILLALLSIFIAVLAWLFIPPLSSRLDVIVGAMVWAVAWGFAPVWFLQGLERMRDVAVLELVTRAIATFGVFVIVREPWQVHYPLFLNGFSAAISSLLGIVWILREYKLDWPRLRLSLRYLSLGKDLFIFRLVVSLYTAANPLILGFFAPPTIVGVFSGAEKIVNAAHVGMVMPFNGVVYPKISNLWGKDRREAARFWRQMAFALSMLGLLSTLVLYLLAPTLVYVLLGPGYSDSSILLRVLSMELPFVVVFNIFGVQWMLPLGRDKPFNRIVMLAGVFNLVAGSFAAFFFGARGISQATVLAHAFSAVSVFVYLATQDLLPWKFLGGGR